MKDINKVVSKGGFYLCWLLIVVISIIYAISTANPRETRVFNTIETPNIDPLIHVDTQFYTLPQRMYNYQHEHTPPNRYLIKKSENFYSGIGSLLIIAHFIVLTLKNILLKPYSFYCFELLHLLV